MAVTNGINHLGLALDILDAGQGEAVVTHRQPGCGVKPVLEVFALAHQPIENFRLVVGDTRPQQVVVSALNHRDGVYLHVTEVFNGALHRGFTAAE